VPGHPLALTGRGCYNEVVRIAIAGAGIGGLALAQAVIRGGHDVVVLEAAAAPRAGGAAVSIWPNGHAALRRLGTSLPASGQRVERLSVLRADGSELYDVDVARLEAVLGYETRLLRRRDLIDHLLAAVPDGVVAFGREVTRVESDPGGGMRVLTQTGPEVTADLVVGADGHRSAVRRYVCDTGPARPTGIATWQGVDPVPVELADRGRSLYIQGDAGWCGLMPAGDGQLQWWFDVPAEIADSIPADDRTHWLQERFAGWPAPVADVLAAIDGAGIETWPYTRHPVPRQLSRETAVLIGDAAHAMPPSLAQGASQTLEDAFVLVRAIDRCAGLPNALASYQKLRRRKVAAVSRIAGSRLALRGPPRWTAPLGRLMPATVTTAVVARMLTSVSNSLTAD
jgi:FAD-dependent urate hydroxylase